MMMSLISARMSDHAWLEELRRDVYRDLFLATWGGWDESRHASHFSACIGRGHIAIIEWDGVRVGMVQLFEDDRSVEVGEIQVHTRHQNRGIGTRVLTDIIAKARQQRKTVRLSTGLKNGNAVRLYERLGFRHVAQSETHYHMECD
jgi:ribosomal protein S18 acetylase RimI-like enzyme